ncbi:unnamed protein product [Rotaria magnacalcarata]|uniref:Uncharacterized protein n=1 Tax=Rotaria magnacalcarata TaxID=392030 RepID=A0A819R3F0_9BILA|nr:unnamed protein product [Rotaria magnacalcarata]
MIQHELNIKIVSTNGQISIGKKYAGSQVQIIEQDNDTLLIKRGKFIPNNERWLYEGDNLQKFRKALKEAKNRKPQDNFEEMMTKLERAIENERNFMLSKQYKRDYFAEAHQLLKQQGFSNYIERLLPAGKYQGNEYVVKNPTRSDGKAGSFSINVITGKWSDFATDDVGSDLISLTAYIKGISNIEACFYIGVPRPENTNSKRDIVELPKPLTPANANIIDDEIFNTIQDIKQEDSQPTGIERLGQLEPSLVTGNSDAELPSQKPVPEFTVDLIGRRTKDRFKDGRITFYRYYSSKNVPVGCVVRCDMDIEGDKVKSFAQFSYDRIKEKWQSSWSGEEVTIAPDNDTTGAKYARTLNDILQRVEAKSVRSLDVKKLGRYTIVEGKPQSREQPVPDKYDLADIANDGWTADLINEWMEHKDFAPFFEIIRDAQAVRDLPKEGEECFHIKGINYKLNKKHNVLWWEMTKTDGRSGETTKTWLTLSGYIKPTYCMEDSNGDHGVDETASEKDTTKLLLLKGLPISHLKPDNCYALNFYLNNFEPERRAIGVDMVGWQGDNEA